MTFAADALDARVRTTVAATGRDSLEHLEIPTPYLYLVDAQAGEEMEMADRQRSSGTNSGCTTTPQRSKLMARVRQNGTAPELVVRDILERGGHRFSVNGKSLPGSPDIFDSERKRAIFVHGCFWHRHAGCRACTTPKSNAAFWQSKFEQNVARDRRKVRQLRRLGYRVLTVWECQVKSPVKLARLERRLDRFFRGAA